MSGQKYLIQVLNIQSNKVRRAVRVTADYLDPGCAGSLGATTSAELFFSANPLLFTTYNLPILWF